MRFSLYSLVIWKQRNYKLAENQNGLAHVMENAATENCDVFYTHTHTHTHAHTL